MTMNNFDSYLITVLEKSIEKHGPDKPLTLSHFLGLVKLAQKKAIEHSEREDKFLDDTYNEVMADAYRYGRY